ncbi:MAG: hypothetical protein CML56_10370 [Rhodobacteraceae bacterium]|nr:hypothetical protein [Paracoccaceae bacterium]
MASISLNLFHQTVQGPQDGLKDWYYHFKGNSGDYFVVHELNHTDMAHNITKRQNIMAAGEFMVELKYPQQAKEKLQSEIDNVRVDFVRPF